MKYCRACGIENRASATDCANCGHSFSAAVDPDAPRPAIREVTYPRSRPDGGVPMLLGWVWLGLSVVLGLIALNADDPKAAFVMQAGSGAFFSLFLVFWSVGYIVRAISFLPASSE